MLQLRAWPERALETIEEMIRTSLIECLQGFEHEGQRVTAILMSRPMTDAWRAIWDRRERYQLGPASGGPAVRESAMFFGTPITTDRSLDPRGGRQGDDLVGNIRVVSDGHGSDPVEVEIRNRPDALRYDIQVRSRHQTRRQSFTYAYVREASRVAHENERREMPVQNVTTGEYQAQEAKRMPRPREMSDLMIAWLT